MSERGIIVLLVLATVLLGAGCQHDMDDLETYIAEVHSRGPGRVEGLPRLRLPAPAPRPTVRQDPFRADWGRLGKTTMTLPGFGNIPGRAPSQ